MSWFRQWRKRRNCMHQRYRPGGNSETWIKSQLIDCGMRKMFWCEECGKVWFR